MTEFKVGDEVWVKGVINQIDKGNVWDLYISTRENGVWIDSSLDECIPQNDTDEKPRYLRNVLARLRELPEHDREVWLKGIMDEFELDFSHAKWREGYEQGKFDGAVEAKKSNKVIIPQFVAKWIDYCKFTHVDLQHALVVGDVYFYNYANQKDFSELKEFLETENNQKLFARAWLDGYDVEQEKRYEVSIKASGQYLARTKLKEIKFMYNGACSHLTRKELEDAGFGWVFDCEGVEVQEVE
nr:MAG TPA: Protein of unknown function (DUF1642) [Caudoviricetes sp.]